MSVKLIPVQNEKVTVGPNDYAVLAMCLDCEHRWVGIVQHDTPVFELECPNCHKQNSFASFMPSDFFGDEDEASESVH